MNRLLALGAPTFELHCEQWIPQDLKTTFEFFENPHNLEKITPAWLNFKIVDMKPDSIMPGTLISYRLKWLGIPYRWVTLIESWEPGKQFVDTQLNGPYILWHHTHGFHPDDKGVLLTDHVKYRLPFGPLGAIAHALIVKRQLQTVFEFRKQRVAEMLAGGVIHTSAPA